MDFEEKGFAKALWINYISLVSDMSFHRVLMTAILVVAALGAGRVARAAEVVGRGDFAFYLDSATFKASGGRVLHEIYVANVRVTVRIEDLQGNAVIQDAEEHRFFEEERAQADNSLYFQTLIKRYMLDPGVYELSYAIEDLEAPKTSVLGRINKQTNLVA